MNNVVDTKSPRHYSSREVWVLLKAGADRAWTDKWSMSDPITWDKLEYWKSNGSLLPTPEQLEQAKKKTKEYDVQLQRELQELRGYVFIDGEFDRTINGDSVALVRRFSSQRNRQVFFRMNLAKNATQGIPDMNRPQLTVFGVVLHSMDKDGFVDVRPLAIY